MTRLRRRLAVIGGVIVIGVCAVLALFFVTDGPRSNIIDFVPVAFPAKADTEFFYSLVTQLKYSDQIDPQASTLMRGQIMNFLVSPDNKRIAVVANGQLVVVGAQSIFRQVAAVDSIYKEPKPVGQQFFRDDDFQCDSKVLYLIRDEYYASRGSQLFSNKGELWKYNVESGSLQLVLKPFNAYSYFLGVKSGVYFSTPTESGNLQLRYFDGNGVIDINQPNAANISLEQLRRDRIESPFYSFSILDYERKVLYSKGVDLSVDGNSGRQTLVIRGKAYLSVTQGKGFKGFYHCSEMLRSVFLPGDRYFLLNALYCGNYNGQLLIDTMTGEYQRLPADSIVYLTLNTNTYPHYRVTGGGIVIQ